MEIDYTKRELEASNDVKEKLASLREEAKAKEWTFEVGYTEAMDLPIEKITGMKPPADWLEKAKLQGSLERPSEELKKMFQGKCVANMPNFSWADYNGVTPVKNQGACGSCWAFATHGAFEGSYAIINHVIIDSSEQNTLDCSVKYDCNGGWWAYEYLIDKGSAKEADYPYVAKKGTCNKEVQKPYKAFSWGYVDSATNIPSVDKLKKALCTYGPLGVCIKVTNAFQAYTGGVFNEKSNADINHAVTLVGWDDSKQAWRIKNSWGTLWGEAGYSWIDYNSNNIGFAASWVQAKLQKTVTEELQFDSEQTATFKASDHPAAVVFDEKLYCVYQGSGYKGHFFYTTFDGNNWVEKQIPDFFLVESPAMVYFLGRLYCFYQGRNNKGSEDKENKTVGNENIYYFFSPDGTNWGHEYQVSGVKICGHPAVVNYNNKLYCFYQGSKKGKGNENIYYITAKNDENSWNGKSWEEEKRVPNAKISYSDKLENSPAVACFNNKLYCFYGFGDELWFNTFNGEEWRGSTKISEVGVTGHPAVAVYNNKLYCFYQGRNENKLYYTVFGEEIYPAPDKQVPNIQIKKSPELVVYDDKLYCFYEGTGKNNANAIFYVNTKKLE